MQNYLVSFKREVCKPLEKANKCAPNFFSHLKNSFIYQSYFFGTLGDAPTKTIDYTSVRPHLVREFSRFNYCSTFVCIR
jgi:hypothetical protein